MTFKARLENWLSTPGTWRRWGAPLLLVVLAALAFGIHAVRPVAFEWGDAFRPAALNLLAGKSPFEVAGFFNAPWILLPLLPFALLPVDVGSAVVFVVALAAFFWVGYRLHARPLALLAFILSYPVGLCLYVGQIDWIIILGFLFPPQIGLFFVLAKPQIGFAVALYWLVLAWRQGGLKKVLAVFSPVTLALLASFWLYGLWPLKGQNVAANIFNFSLWPLSIVFGLVLVTRGLRLMKMEYFIAASPCFSPFLSAQSWLVPLLVLLPLPAEMLAASLGTWLWYLLRVLAAQGGLF